MSINMYITDESSRLKTAKQELRVFHVHVVNTFI